LAEAMACGLPVVAARLAGITTDLVTDGVEGRLIEGHDPDEYARVLSEVLRHPQELDRMGAAARRRIAQEFDLSRIVDQYAQLYRRQSD
jgi:D-inositol-3-phosphate glycosyltransferase